jgi:hypothetical protein
MKRKDILRPIFGMVLLQPPTLLWCHLTNVPYFENMGIFTIIATLYLIPVYAWYERKFPQP